MRHLQAAGGTAITGAPAVATRVAPYRWLCLGIGLVGFLLDLVVKNAVIANLDPQHPIPLLGGLVTLQLTRNPGAAFSMGENFTVLLTIIAIAALIAVLVFIVPRLRHVGWAVTIGCPVASLKAWRSPHAAGSSAHSSTSAWRRRALANSMMGVGQAFPRASTRWAETISLLISFMSCIARHSAPLLRAARHTSPREQKHS